jgi:signal transduction histidine kinase
VVSVDIEADTARVSVSDMGPGIPEAFRERIFQKFSQAESSSTRTAQGAGLGLSVSRQLVEAIGGSISFDSVVGNGTTFFVRFKVQPS